MEFSDEIIESLRQALAATPDNLPLRKHLAELLLHHQQPEAAIQEFRQVLAQRPDDVKVRLGLAESYLKAARTSAAAALLEDFLRYPSPPNQARVLMARLLLQEGKLESARELYQQARQHDADLQDPELERKLFLQVSSQLQQSSTQPSASQDREPIRERLQPEDAPPTPAEPTALSPLAIPLGGGENEPEADQQYEKPLITFADVGGMDKVKQEIMIKLIQPLQHPELFRAYGKTIGGGLLMYGPPGCGKTHLARATAGEVKAAFISVGINDILEMWLGQSERNLHAVFEQARAMKPCVLFFDEVDALGARRSDMRQSAGRQLINQFLLELDGDRYSNEGVLILAATNAPWHLDSAFRRPGRFDQLLFVPPPDVQARSAILDILLAGKPLEKIDVATLARKSEGFSGADLKALVERTVEDKLREALSTGQPSPVRQKDLLKCLKGLKPTTREWFATARNYALYANQSGFYDDILAYLDGK